MTHRERLETALDLGVPDQVPVTWELVGRAALAFTGDGSWRGQCDAHRLIGSSIFNLQGVGPEIECPLGPGYGHETVEIGTDGPWTVYENRIITPSGTLTERVKVGGVEGDPTLAKRVEPYVKSRADYEILADYLAERAKRARPGEGKRSAEARDYVRDDGLVNHWCVDSTYALANYCDSAQFILDLVDIPDQMSELMQLIHREREAAMEAFNQSAADVMVWDVCWASTSMLSPDLVRRFVIPEAKWAVESIAPGKRIVFFTSGKIRAVLEDLAQCKPHGIQHLDVLGDCDLAEVKRTFGKRFCLMGNVSNVVLAHGTIEEAIEEARRCLRAAMEGGGYIMTTSDEVPADAKIENMRAIVETVAREGVYQ
ncbi:MAG: hypothetical protein N2512_07030 [Armatimonadetes bacterium]|nr:hypothetical protein [Armatimonadota bacterium]